MVVVLTRRGQVWRSVPNTNANQLGESMQIVVPTVTFEVVPISKLDQNTPFALEATHILWAPRWLTLRKLDEVRYGEWTNSLNVTQSFRYVINGRRQFRTGMPNTAYYCTERE